jgi:excisionase family DNA binding protein
MLRCMKKLNSSPRSKPARNLARKPLSTAREIAEILGVSTWTVYDWSRSGRIPAIRATPRVVRFDVDAVLAALEGGRK